MRFFLTDQCATMHILSIIGIRNQYYSFHVSQGTDKHLFSLSKCLCTIPYIIISTIWSSPLSLSVRCHRTASHHTTSQYNTTSHHTILHHATQHSFTPSHTTKHTTSYSRKILLLCTFLPKYFHQFVTTIKL